MIGRQALSVSAGFSASGIFTYSAFFIQFSYSFLMKVTQENWLMRKSKRNGVDVFVWMCTWDSFPKNSFRFISTFLSLLALTDGPESPAGKVMLVTGRNLREITVLGSCCYKMMVVFYFSEKWKPTWVLQKMIQIVTDTTWKKSDPNPKKPESQLVKQVFLAVHVHNLLQ